MQAAASQVPVHSTSIALFVLTPTFRAGDLLLERLKNISGLEFRPTADLDQISEQLKVSPQALIVFQAATKLDFANLSSLLKVYADDFVAGRKACIIVTKINPFGLRAAMKRYGNVEVFATTVSVSDLHASAEKLIMKMVPDSPTPKANAEPEISDLHTVLGNRNGVSNTQVFKGEGLSPIHSAVEKGRGYSKGNLLFDTADPFLNANLKGEALTGPHSVFVPVRDTKHRRSLIKEAISNKAKTIIWSSNFKLRIETQIKSVNEEKNEILLKFFGDRKHRTEALAHGELLANVYLKRCRLFFQLGYPLKDESEGLVYPLPTKFFEVQRRQHFRLDVSQKKTLVRLQVPGSSDAMDATIINISSGGMCVKLPQSVKPNVLVESFAQNLRFEAKGRMIHVAKAKICYVQENNVDRTCNVGLEFAQIDGSSMFHLAFFVHSESLAFWNEILV